MIYKFSNAEENFLLAQPETGMGYQIIEAKESFSYIPKKYIVLNSEVIVDRGPNEQEYIKQVFTEGIQKAKASASQIYLKEIKVLSKHEAFRNTVNESKSEKEKGAKENPIEKANGIDIFVRLSAYLDDKRVDKTNKRLLPGSYSTTESDYNLCKKNGLDPIDRYALPNDEIIKYAFEIRPVKGDELQKGKVQPANGHNGGGDEVYFAKGTSNNTVLNNGEPKPY